MFMRPERIIKMFQPTPSPDLGLGRVKITNANQQKEPLEQRLEYILNQLKRQSHFWPHLASD
jgi:hypothetical protein